MTVEIASLNVPIGTIHTTVAFLRSFGQFEACCFWLGHRQPDGAGLVQAVVVPQQKSNPGNYHIAPEAMVEVAAAVRHHGWKNLAQIHSHPGDDVHHSAYDDQMANSRRALSLVFPRYGRLKAAWRWRRWIWRLWPSEFPDAIGIHAFIGGRWTYLAQADRAPAIKLVAGPHPEVIDLRT
ncbi:MAG TPA: Mov34/MPN/PAD-1 family protein [Stellaceae bacterium]|nr:Mov34/MPN/PAD-1 family protein [Stellaceae bacterium]